MEIRVPRRLRELEQRFLMWFVVTVLEVGEEAERVCFDEFLLIAEGQRVVDEGIRMKSDGECAAATFGDERLVVQACLSVFFQECGDELSSREMCQLERSF